MNIPPAVKSGAKFGLGVIVTLFVVALLKKHVLPKAPASVQNLANTFLP